MNTNDFTRAFDFLDSWLALRQSRFDVPGLTVAIGHKGKVLFNKSYGYANLETKERLTPKHIFRIASHSKTFTATAIMQLSERGELTIDDPIANHLPWLKKHEDKRMSKVTIRQLMSHSAGLIRDGLDADHWQLLKRFPDAAGLKREILSSDLIFDTNTRMKYSNLGYGLLGMIIESVSGQTFDQYIQEHILDELKLTSTGTEYNRKVDSRLAAGYTRADLKNRRLPIAMNLDTRALASATGFYSTSEELCKYISAHAMGNGKLLSDESKKEMQRLQWHVPDSPYNEEYGLGIAIDRFERRRYVGHRGSFPGHKTMSVLNQSDQLAIVIMASAIDVDARWIVRGVLSVLDHFQAHGNSREPYTRFQGRFMSLWNITEIVATGKKVVAIDPTLWEPFSSPEELEVVDDKTLKIGKTYGYWSENESISYHFRKNGSIESIRYAGITMWPEADYMKMLADKTEIAEEVAKARR